MEILDFYSRVTRVSLELPVGWEELEEGENSVTYYYELDEDEDDKSADPKVAIAFFAAGSTDPAVLKKASQGLLYHKPNHRSIRQSDITVDGFPALEDVFSYVDPDLGGEVYHHNAFVLVDNVLYSFSAFCPMEMRDELQSDLEAAIRSARFIIV